LRKNKLRSSLLLLAVDLDYRKIAIARLLRCASNNSFLLPQRKGCPQFAVRLTLGFPEVHEVSFGGSQDNLD
jgi:hypothetical protein